MISEGEWNINYNQFYSGTDTRLLCSGAAYIPSSIVSATKDFKYQFDLSKLSEDKLEKLETVNKQVFMLVSYYVNLYNLTFSST